MIDKAGDKSDWPQILLDVERKLFKYYTLGIYERCLYYHLISITHAQGRNNVTISLSTLASALGVSVHTPRKYLRSLAQKGVIELEQRSSGFTIALKLPNELNISEEIEEELHVDIEELDFFSNRIYLPVLLSREDGKCFYCLRTISEETCELDHVVPQVSHGDNGYRNIVATCHSCNSKKQQTSAEDFLRQLYRQSLLSEMEFAERVHTLESLRDGKIVPNVESIVNRG